MRLIALALFSVPLASAAANCHDALAPNEIGWNCNSWRSGGPAVSNPDVTSFDFLDEVLRKVARKELFPNLKQIVVTGHWAPRDWRAAKPSGNS